MEVKKLVKAPKIITSILIIMAVVILLKFVWPFSTLLLQQHSVRKELNNPFINSRYNGWKIVQLDDISIIKVPEMWGCKKSGSLLEIYLSEMRVARGVQMPSDNDVFHGKDEFNAYQERFNAFAATLVDYPVNEIEFRDLTALHMGTGARYYEATFHAEQGEATTYLVLLLPQGEKHDYMILFENGIAPRETVLQQIEAMAYSYRG